MNTTPGSPNWYPPPPVPIAPPIGSGPKAKRTGLIVGIVAAAAVLGGGGVYLATKDSGDAKPSTDSTVSTTSTVSTVLPTSDEIAHAVVQLVAMLDGTPVWTGSGTILTADGLILTNAHVVAKSAGETYDTLVVNITTVADQPPTATYEADVVGFDPELDLATVQIARDMDGTPLQATNLPHLGVGDSDSVQLGDALRIFGYPGIGGETITFTEGSVSGFTSQAGVDGRAWVKTDATIAGGNSGGTAVNQAGELVAIPTRASATDGDVTDCRRIQDTNGDNVVDENDSCIPIGGFINGLRPVNLAEGVISQGQLGEVVSADLDPPSTADTSGASFSYPVFSSDVTASNLPVDDVQILPTGAPKVCGFFDYAGLTDGVKWSALWLVNGELSEAGSLFDQDWVGGAEGTDWWVCFVGNDGGLVDGIYELALNIGDQTITSNTLWVGDAFSAVDVNIVNNSGADVCYLYLSSPLAQGWGPDRLGADQVVAIDSSVVVSVVGAVYQVRALDCQRAVLMEDYTGVDVTAGGSITVTLTG